MKRSFLSSALVVAGLAAGGLVQAQTTDVPTKAGEASTMTQGVPNAATTNSPYPDGTAVVRSPAVVSTTTYHYYTVPSVVSGAPVVIYDRYDTAATYHRGSASATTNVPGRAGEASTMTGGVPNMATDNNPPVVLGSARQLAPGHYYLY